MNDKSSNLETSLEVDGVKIKLQHINLAYQQFIVDLANKDENAVPSILKRMCSILFVAELGISSVEACTLGACILGFTLAKFSTEMISQMLFDGILSRFEKNAKNDNVIKLAISVFDYKNYLSLRDKELQEENTSGTKKERLSISASTSSSEGS